MKYSKLTGGFYDPLIHGTNIPPDAVDITQAEHAALMQAQQTGQVIVPNKSGCPVSTSRPPYPFSTWNQAAEKWDSDPAQSAEYQRNQKAAQLSATDEYMPRVTEDLIDALIAKGVITQADLPEAVKTKLTERKTIRTELSVLTTAKP